MVDVSAMGGWFETKCWIDVLHGNMSVDVSPYLYTDMHNNFDISIIFLVWPQQVYKC